MPLAAFTAAAIVGLATAAETAENFPHRRSAAIVVGTIGCASVERSPTRRRDGGCDCSRGAPKLSHRSGHALLTSRRTRSSETAPIESGSRDKRGSLLRPL